MHTQRQLLALACERQHVNYTGLADLLSISRQYISQVKYGRPLGGATALRLAELCGMRAEYVLACVEYSRAARLEELSVLPIWEKIAKRFAASVAAVTVAALLIVASAASSKAYAASITEQSFTRYTLCEVAAIVAAWLQRLVRGAHRSALTAIRLCPAKHSCIIT